MKTISLAKANKIRNLLNDKIIPQLEREILDSRSVSFVGFEELDEVNAIVSAATEKFFEASDNRNSAVNAIKNLKILISDINAKNGIDKIMTNIAVQTNEIKFLRNFISGKPKSKDEILKELAFRRANTENITSRYSYNSNGAFTVEIKLLNHDTDNIKDSISSLEKNIRDMEESRNTINFSTMVSLSDELVKVLESFKLF